MTKNLQKPKYELKFSQEELEGFAKDRGYHKALEDVLAFAHWISGEDAGDIRNHIQEDLCQRPCIRRGKFDAGCRCEDHMQRN